MGVLIEPAPLREGVAAWFTGRDREGAARAVGAPGNLAHRRPHRPADLVRERDVVAEVVGISAERWHLMRQVHGASVGLVEHDTPPGYELRDVDAAITAELDRPLVVQVADCVPVLFAGDDVVGAAHAGRRGVQDGVVGATVEALVELSSRPGTLVAAIGPAVGGCCYEVPEALQREVLQAAPTAEATTTWGTPSLDLRSAVRDQLVEAGVQVVSEEASCTHCDTRWFSHRRDPDGGRQIGLVVRRGTGARPAGMGAEVAS